MTRHEAACRRPQSDYDAFRSAGIGSSPSTFAGALTGGLTKGRTRNLVLQTQGLLRMFTASVSPSGRRADDAVRGRVTAERLVLLDEVTWGYLDRPVLVWQDRTHWIDRDTAELCVGRGVGRISCVPGWVCR